MRRIVRGLARWIVLAVAVTGFGLVPATSASATGAGYENFTMSGDWTCTYGCGLKGTWGIAGNATTCNENEVEVFPPVIDPAPAVACAAGTYFTGDITSSCTDGVCSERGIVSFYLRDHSDNPNFTLGPIDVEFTGVAILVNVAAQGTTEQGYVLTGAFDALNRYEGTPIYYWSAAGAVLGGGCAGDLAFCDINRSFDATLTGVQVDE